MTNRFIGEFDDSMLQNMEEFDKRYKNSYLLIESEKNTNYYCYQDHAFTPSENLKLRFYNKEAGNVFVNSFNGKQKVSVRLPEVGYFNVPHLGVAYIFNRRPTRQFRRGLCSENFTIHTPLDMVLATIKLNIRNRLGGDFLIYALEKHFLPLNKVLSMFEEDSFSTKSAAISNTFALSKSHLENEERPLLWFLKNIIGFVDNKKKEMEVLPFYKQEVIDLMANEDTTWHLKLLKV